MTLAEWVAIIVSALAALAASVLGIWSTRQDQARARIDTHLENTDRLLGEQGNRLTIVEQRINYLPNADTYADAFDKLYGKLDAIKDQVSKLQGTEELATAIADHLGRQGQVERRSKPRS